MGFEVSTFGMQARFYAPQFHRFMSTGPSRDQHFEQTQSWNIYSYVQNAPIMKVDPTGLRWIHPNSVCDAPGFTLRFDSGQNRRGGVDSRDPKESETEKNKKHKQTASKQVTVRNSFYEGKPDRKAPGWVIRSVDNANKPAKTEGQTIEYHAVALTGISRLVGAAKDNILNMFDKTNHADAALPGGNTFGFYLVKCTIIQPSGLSV